MTDEGSKITWETPTALAGTAEGEYKGYRRHGTGQKASENFFNGTKIRYMLKKNETNIKSPKL